MIESRLDLFSSAEARPELAAVLELVFDGSRTVLEALSEAPPLSELPGARFGMMEPRIEAAALSEVRTDRAGVLGATSEIVSVLEARQDSLQAVGGAHWIETISELLPLSSPGGRDMPELRSEPFFMGETPQGGDMPTAHSFTTASFSAASGATATQADLPASRAAPATRFRVRLINTHPNDRLFVGRSQAEAQASDAEIIEADSGVWVDDLDPAIPVWVRPIGANAITVRIIQYATA